MKKKVKTKNVENFLKNNFQQKKSKSKIMLKKFLKKKYPPKM